MTLALDSSVIIDIERGNTQTLAKLGELRKEYLGKASMPFMVYVELLYGIEATIKHKEGLLQQLERFHFLSPTKSTAKELARLKRTYDARGIIIGLADLFIAAQVIDEGLVLVTKDQGFKRIEELEVILI